MCLHEWYVADFASNLPFIDVFFDATRIICFSQKLEEYPVVTRNRKFEKQVVQIIVQEVNKSEINAS
ncbi:MAG: hypothetical protein GWO20_11570 [Candidatus Korarchaeota archaeon]|nr:hypothetical protein [Candidatus Korarchaeota archaeon]